jgi:uncharacterized protein YqeY
MNLTEKINEEMKSALKSGQKERLLTIRSIRALILEFEKSGSGKIMTEEDEIRILSSAAKKRKDSIEQYENAGRMDLAQNEKNELEIISEFLPKQLSEDEILETVRRIALEIGAEGKKDFGKLMQNAAKELKGKADGSLIKSIVEKVLG